MKLDFTSLFCQIDDFCQSFEPLLQQHLLKDQTRPSRNRAAKLSTSEMMTIVIGFHQARFRDFKKYYLLLFTELKRLFPGLVSYTRFVQLMPRLFLPMTAFALSQRGKCSGISYVDSTTLQVCHSKRINRNKVFRGIAQRGRSTKGWFYGFKLHLVINDCGELLSFQVTPGNTDDRKPVKELAKSLWGKLFGDKGYISASLAQELLEKGTQLITSVRDNMKNKLMSLEDKALLRKRSIIETVNDQLKNISQIEHTRHRSPMNFMVNLMAGLIAYMLKPNKPSITPLKPQQILFA